MSGLARTCVCGMRVEPGEVCACGWGAKAQRPPERGRAGYRKSYSSAEYRRNRLERYRLVGGRCETPGCGIALKGELHPDGVAWECDHVIELSQGGTDDVGNLRCRCMPHHKAKTRLARKSNRSSGKRR